MDKGRLLHVLALLGMATVVFISGMALRSLPQSDRPMIYLPPPEGIIHSHFGYAEAIADSLWIRLIQDIDACGKSRVDRSQMNLEMYGKEAKPNMSPRDHSKAEKSEYKGVIKSYVGVQKQKVCIKGWSFRLLDAITNLAPRFRMPYALGAPTLSVLVDDHIGAKIIFDKGVEAFPKDWSILYRAAYHYLFELNDPASAADLMNRAAKAGAPYWVQSLAARLYTQSGQLLLGISTLMEYKKVFDDPEQIAEVQQRIDALKVQLKKSGHQLPQQEN